ncbi:glycine zipper domain-containing protein [Oceanidesulfovibrio marinus]|uniref:Cell envelope biogenesis protein OmpA n=1 Tax=Oceanidesulfovibrio marinus TaxID=370038 RepID=A0A6P1ZIL0_9BACT|nr:glycine zipper domain-containing protein [Oceanidesulfovibrio marinus]QJT08151.1 cell envelope biogenesis protein OmpA [Oceanidesulfovibrio marinus]TVM35047.1 cell envelope biogenesis protein OmpA [Oceanidesulfovibrio marinus]
MIKAYFIPLVLALAIAVGACTNMTPTQQGVTSGGLLGAGAGAGISALSGGNAGVGALIGGAAGAIAGGLIGHEQERRNQYGD